MLVAPEREPVHQQQPERCRLQGQSGRGQVLREVKKKGLVKSPLAIDQIFK